MTLDLKTKEIYAWDMIFVDKNQLLRVSCATSVSYVLKKKKFTDLKSDFQVKNDKGMFTHTEIIANNKVSDEFLEKVLQGTIERDKPESWDVVDIKLVTPKDKGDEISNLSLEIKFIVSENQNENGLNMHGIYWYMKKINERIRLEWYVTPDYISLVADKFIKNLDFILISNTWRPEEEWDSSDKYKTELFQDLRGQAYISKELDLRNPHIKAHIDDHLKQWIINYFKSRLLLVHKKWSKKPHYSNKRALLMSERGISVELTSGVL